MTTALLDPPAPEVEDGTRREFLGGGLAAGLLVAGCGADDPAADPEASRRIRHALGTAEVPVRPRRVVTMDAINVLQTALGVGAPVVGSLGASRAEPFPAFLDTSGVQVVGYEVTPDLEAISGLRPDLIVGVEETVEPAYTQLRRIAPTVALTFDFAGGWKRNVRAVADTVGRRAQADEEVAAFERRAAEFGARNRAILQRTTVTLLRVVPGELRVEPAEDGFFGGPVVAEAGVRRPANQLQGLELSGEQIAQLDADVIINMGTGGGFADEVDEELARLQASPLWKRLRAVRDGRVYNVDPGHWFGQSPQAAELVLDDLQRLLVEGS